MESELYPARPGDYDEIIAVVDKWWGRAVAGSLPRLFLDHFHRTSLVARNHDGTLTGFLIGFLSPSQPGQAYIHFVGVAPVARASGLGRCLYEEFFAVARASGCTQIAANTSPVNTGSVAFHQKMGFMVTGPTVDYNGPGKDRIVFYRSI
jgi:predicted GNAT superfamily acetyltransferase